MGINTGLQPIDGLPEANYFDLVHYDISNRGASAADAVLNVWWRASVRQDRTPTEEDPSTFTLKTAKESCGPATYFGARLSAICTDAFTRAKAYSTAGAPDDAAYALGQRDAIYAALRADSYF